MANPKVLYDLPLGARILGGFIAGFLATLIFHQLTLAVLYALHLAPFGPFSMMPTWPFGVPVVFSLAFWGGIWGIIYVLVHVHFPDGMGYWVSSFLFGGIAPTLVALLLVLPLKGKPIGGGWQADLWTTAFLINGAWAVGTGVFMLLIFRRYTRSRAISFR